MLPVIVRVVKFQLAESVVDILAEFIQARFLFSGTDDVNIRLSVLVMRVSSSDHVDVEVDHRIFHGKDRIVSLLWNRAGGYLCRSAGFPPNSS